MDCYLLLIDDKISKLTKLFEKLKSDVLIEKVFNKLDEILENCKNKI